MASKEDTLPAACPESTNNPFSCDECKKVLPNLAKLRCHKQTHANPESVTCNICEKVFALPANLIRHRRIHTGVRPYICPICQMAFTQGTHMKRHMKLVHKVNNNCSAKTGIMQKPRKGFRRMEENGSSNNRGTGNKQKPKRGCRTPGNEYECDVCGRNFNKAKSLKNHKRSHTSEKSFVCEICGRCFKYLGRFTTHKRQHTEPFSCNICKKSFANANCLSVHKMIHSDTQPYACDLCGKTFGQKGHVEQHKTTAHLQERSYETRSKRSAKEGVAFAKREQQQVSTNVVENGYELEKFPPGIINPISGEKDVGFAKREQLLISTKLDENTNQLDQFSAAKVKSISGENEGTIQANPQICKQSSENRQNQLGHGKVNPEICEISKKSGNHENYLGHGVAKSHSQNSMKSENLVQAKGNTHGLHSDVLHPLVNLNPEPDNANQQIETKPKTRPNQCDICYKTFKQRSYVKTHKRTHSGEKPYACECGKSYSFAHRLRSHLRSGKCVLRQVEQSDGKEPSYKCYYCSKVYHNFSMLKMHQKRHEEKATNPFQCQFCSKVFKNKGHLDMHERVHTGQRPYQCDLCGKSFKQSSHVLSHKKSVHKKRTANSEDNLESTNILVSPTSESPQKQTRGKGRTVHSKGKSTKNLACITSESPQQIHSNGRTVNSEDSGESTKDLESPTSESPRQQTRSKERTVHSKGKSTNNLACTTSESPEQIYGKGRTVNSEDNLESTKNLESPTSENPQKLKSKSSPPKKDAVRFVYQCEFCAKTFAQGDQLVLHRKMHILKFGPFDCQTCGKSFKIRTNLFRHELVHSGERPHVCEICGKGCTQKSNLKSHLKRVHNIVNMLTKSDIGNLQSETVCSTSQDDGIQKSSNSNKNSLEVPRENDSTPNAFKQSDVSAHSDKIQNEADCSTDQQLCRAVKKDSSCSNKSEETSRIDKHNVRNLFTELSIRKRHYENANSTAAEVQNASNKNASKASAFNENDNNASVFEENNVNIQSDKLYTEIICSSKAEQPENLHSKIVCSRDKLLDKETGKSYLQGNSNVEKSEYLYTRIKNEAKINSRSNSRDESSNNFETNGTNMEDIGHEIFENISQEKFEEHQLNHGGDKDSEKMFICCECGERFEKENSMIMHCVDVH